MDFPDSKILLQLCKDTGKPISEIMMDREIADGGYSKEQVLEKMEKVLEIMQNSVSKPLNSKCKTMGGLIGGESRHVIDHIGAEDNICGGVLSRAIAYSMAVLETNASMGLIVAAPTGGASGVLPGVLLAVKEEKHLSDEQIYAGLFNASAIGYLFMRNATVSGAEAGCQAEVGVASAMSASALVEILGGSPDMCLNAASLAISNLLGLVCDPIAGLVESPCQSRNALGAANAITCAELSLSGVKHPIPFDEMVEAMYQVGRSIPFELRETALGGCAGTPTGHSLAVKAKACK